MRMLGKRLPEHNQHCSRRSQIVPNSNQDTRWAHFSYDPLVISLFWYFYSVSPTCMWHALHIFLKIVPTLLENWWMIQIYMISGDTFPEQRLWNSFASPSSNVVNCKFVNAILRGAVVAVGIPANACLGLWSWFRRSCQRRIRRFQR